MLDWLIFNAGSSHSVNPMLPKNNVAFTFGNTCLSAAAGGLTALLIRTCEKSLYGQDPNNQYDFSRIINAILCSCVSVTAASNNIALYSACAIGVTIVLIYSAFSRLLVWLHIDDPLEVTAVHGVSGFYGLLVVGLFDKDYGFFYTGSFK